MEPNSPVTVFLSYASEDRLMAAGLTEALRSAGIEVWFDQDALKGGDAWDLQIRERIRTCTFFVPLISSHTEARAEGYFRREWRLAVERSQDMADDRPFLLPVAISPVALPNARVPERFRDLQWLHVSERQQAPVLVKRILNLQEQLGRRAPPDSGAHRQNRRRGSPRFAAAWLLGIILLATAVGLGAWWAAGKTSAGATAEKNSVAVIPFVNLGGDPSYEYFSDGMTEELLGALSRNAALRTVARTSCFAFKGRNIPAQEIGIQLRVMHLIEGTVRRVDDRVLIAVQIINAVNGYRQWSHTLETKQADMISIPAKLAQLIAAQLNPTEATASLVPATYNPDAYDAYLRGRSYQAKVPTQENLTEAIFHLRRATELDPSFAQAWSGFALNLIRHHNTGFSDSEEDLARAREAIAVALRLQPELAEAHQALANYYTVNWTNQAQAQAELVVGVKNSPNNPDIIVDLAGAYLNLGQRTKAAETVRRACQLDPQNSDTANFAGVVYEKASLYAEAIAERERAFQLTGWTVAIAGKATAYRNWKGDIELALKTMDSVRPTGRSDAFESGIYWWTKAMLHTSEDNFEAALTAVENMPEIAPNPFYYNTRVFNRARIREAMGAAKEARADYERALEIAEKYRAQSPRKVRAYTQLALIYAGLGRSQEAWAAAETALQLIPPSENPYAASRGGLRVMAQVAARTGRTERALEVVKSQVEGGFWKYYDLMLDDDWRILRRDPRFLEIAKRAAR